MRDLANYTAAGGALILLIAGWMVMKPSDRSPRPEGPRRPPTKPPATAVVPPKPTHAPAAPFHGPVPLHRGRHARPRAHSQLPPLEPQP